MGLRPRQEIAPISTPIPPAHRAEHLFLQTMRRVIRAAQKTNLPRLDQAARDHRVASPSSLLHRGLSALPKCLRSRRTLLARLAHLLTATRSDPLALRPNVCVETWFSHSCNSRLPAVNRLRVASPSPLRRACTRARSRSPSAAALGYRPRIETK